MDEKNVPEIQSGASLQPEVTEPTIGSSLQQSSNSSQTPLQPQPTVLPQPSQSGTQNTPQVAAPQPTTIAQQPAPIPPAHQATVTPQPMQAQTPAPTPGLQPASASGGMASGIGSKPLRSKWFLPAIFAGFLVLGGGAAAYVTVFQKSPESLWKSALNNTVDGIDAYLDTSLNQEQEKGFIVDGNFKVSSPIAIDGSMKGQWYESNGSLKADIGAGGVRIDTELKTISDKPGGTPDIYMKVSGLEGIDSLIESLGGYGSNVGTQLGDVNGQWYFVDHTLIDQYIASAEGTADAPSFTEEDAKEAIDKVMVVLRERMFSTDDKAVFKIVDKIGKEDFEGTSSYKMTVKVDQNNFKDLVVALKDAAKETKLNDLMTQGSDNKSLEEALSFDELIKELEKADFTDAKADVWVESRGGFIRNVRFYPSEDKKGTNYIDFGMNYTGGDVFPFLVRATIDDGGVVGTLAFGFDINQKNGDGRMSLAVDLGGDGMNVKADGELSITGSNDEVSNDKPENAKSYLELLTSLSSGLYGNPTSPDPFDDFAPSDSLLTPTYPLDDFEL